MIKVTKKQYLNYKRIGRKTKRTKNTFWLMEV